MTPPKSAAELALERKYEALRLRKQVGRGQGNAHRYCEDLTVSGQGSKRFLPSCTPVRRKPRAAALPRLDTAPRNVGDVPWLACLVNAVLSEQ